MHYLQWKSDEIDEFFQKIIVRNGILLTTTDTVLGLVSSLSLESKHALDRIKGRQEKPYIVLIGSFDQLSDFITPEANVMLLPLLKQLWPGPVTIITHALSTLPDHIKGANNTIALRFPDHEGLQKAARSLSGIFSTSANRSGTPPPEEIAHIDPLILKDIEAIIYDPNKSTHTTPSTIIDCTTFPYKVLRRGMLDNALLNMIIASST